MLWSHREIMEVKVIQSQLLCLVPERGEYLDTEVLPKVRSQPPLGLY